MWCFSPQLKVIKRATSFEPGAKGAPTFSPPPKVQIQDHHTYAHRHCTAIQHHAHAYQIFPNQIVPLHAARHNHTVPFTNTYVHAGDAGSSRWRHGWPEQLAPTSGQIETDFRPPTGLRDCVLMSHMPIRVTLVGALSLWTRASSPRTGR